MGSDGEWVNVFTTYLVHFKFLQLLLLRNCAVQWKQRLQHLASSLEFGEEELLLQSAMLFRMPVWEIQEDALLGPGTEDYVLLSLVMCFGYTVPEKITFLWEN